MKDSTTAIFQKVARREMTSTDGTAFLMRERESPWRRFVAVFFMDLLLPAVFAVVMAFALFGAACLLTGCAGTLDRSIIVANALGAVAADAGPRIEHDFAAADHACLWTGTGAPSSASLDAQRACMTKVRSDYGPALKAWDAFQVAWGPLPMLIALAQALEGNAAAPVVAQVAAAIPKVIAAAQALTTAYMGLASKAVTP